MLCSHTLAHAYACMDNRATSPIVHCIIKMVNVLLGGPRKLICFQPKPHKPNTSSISLLFFLCFATTIFASSVLLVSIIIKVFISLMLFIRLADAIFFFISPPSAARCYSQIQYSNNNLLLLSADWTDVLG